MHNFPQETIKEKDDGYENMFMSFLERSIQTAVKDLFTDNWDVSYLFLAVLRVCVCHLLVRNVHERKKDPS